MEEIILNSSRELWKKIVVRAGQENNSFDEECCRLLNFAFDRLVEEEEKANKLRLKAAKELEILAQLRGEQWKRK